MINKVTLIGNLGKKPEIRYSQNGAAIASFNIATTESWKDGKGVKQEHTEWHRLVAFGRLGEICGEYLDKGTKVFIEGKLQTRKWDDKDGVTRYTTEIVAKEMKILSPRPAGASSQQEPMPPSDHNDPPAPHMPPPPVIGDYPDDVPF